MALVYADDVSAEQVPMLQDQGRYAVVDDCPTKTFAADDVSLQVVDGENLFVILLDSTSPNGYLRKELPECGNWNTPTAFPRIPRDTISVKVYRDTGIHASDARTRPVMYSNIAWQIPQRLLAR